MGKGAEGSNNSLGQNMSAGGGKGGGMNTASPFSGSMQGGFSQGGYQPPNPQQPYGSYTANNPFMSQGGPYNYSPFGFQQQQPNLGNYFTQIPNIMQQSPFAPPTGYAPYAGTNGGLAPAMPQTGGLMLNNAPATGNGSVNPNVPGPATPPTTNAPNALAPGTANIQPMPWYGGMIGGMSGNTGGGGGG